MVEFTLEFTYLISKFMFATKKVHTVRPVEFRMRKTLAIGKC